MTKKPKKKLRYMQRQAGLVEARIRRNTIYPAEKGGAAYVPLEAVKALMCALRAVRHVQKEINKKKING